jgi:hypothetical protein
MTAFLKAAIVHTVFAAIFYCVWRAGYAGEAWANDIAYIVPAIITIFALGLVVAWYRMAYAYWCAETIIVLGFAGTLLGIWTAFSGIDPAQIGDVNAIASVISILMHGLGAAIWTTIVGVFFSVWLNAALEVMEG